MSEWKNPQHRPEWDKPFLFGAEEETQKPQFTFADFVRGLFGFLTLSVMNGTALFVTVFLLDRELSYRNSVLIGMVYVCWRAYDRVVFSRFGK